MQTRFSRILRPGILALLLVGFQAGVQGQDPGQSDAALADEARLAVVEANPGLPADSLGSPDAAADGTRPEHDCQIYPQPKQYDWGCVQYAESITTSAELYSEISYPREAWEAGVDGITQVFFHVCHDGIPDSIKVVREEPAGYGFGEAAKRGIEKMRFKVYTPYGAVRMQQVIKFDPKQVDPTTLRCR